MKKERRLSCYCKSFHNLLDLTFSKDDDEEVERIRPFLEQLFRRCVFITVLYNRQDIPMSKSDETKWYKILNRIKMNKIKKLSFGTKKTEQARFYFHSAHCVQMGNNY